MRHVLKRNKGFIAIPAVLALTLAACDTDDDSPTIEEDTEEEQAVLPSGVFGDDCQELLAAADIDDTDVTTDADADADADADTDGFDDDNGLDDEDDELGIALASAEDDDGFGEDDADATNDGFGEDDGFEDDADATDDEFGEDDGVEDDDTADGLGTEGDAEADAEAEAETDTTVTVDEQQLREMTILEALEALPDFETLVAELRGSEFEAELEQESDVTLFAATDEAFEAVDGTGDGLDADDGVDTDDTNDTDDGVDTDGTDDGELGTTTTITIDDRVLAYHLHLDGALFAQDLVDQEDVTTAADDAGDLRVTADGDVVTVDADESTAQVTCANIETQDGTIHVIDEVLVPREDTDATDEETDADTDADAGTETDTEADTDTDVDADAEADADFDADADAETDDS